MNFKIPHLLILSFFSQVLIAITPVSVEAQAEGGICPAEGGSHDKKTESLLVEIQSILNETASFLSPKGQGTFVFDSHNDESNQHLYRTIEGENTLPHPDLLEALHQGGVRHLFMEGLFQDGVYKDVHYHSLEYYDEEARMIKLLTGYLILEQSLKEGGEAFAPISRRVNQIVKQAFGKKIDITKENLPALQEWILKETAAYQGKPNPFIQKAFANLVTHVKNPQLNLGPTIRHLYEMRDRKMRERVQDVLLLNPKSKAGESFMLVAGAMHGQLLDGDEKLELTKKEAKKLFDKNKNDLPSFYKNLLSRDSIE